VAIGRIYVVALERNKKQKTETNEVFYFSEIIFIFKDTHIDEKPEQFRSINLIDLDSLKKAIVMHSFLTE
jgi:hypothetical protein